ncbi:class II histone deacetylase [Pseudomonas oryzihabitans]|uniref:class II histone deacetylase n=1 Tax=Pseudomonas oryzihabitans TaxID=47885 RepID=UPI00241FEE97|nr:class II histone deacetylase [Pseudomonas oryzihabitans]
MARRTAFFHAEQCFWHSAGMHALVLPVGGWVQPPAAAGFAESPESKRRLKNLLDLSGLTRQLLCPDALAAAYEDALRVHPAAYLERLKTVSDAGGGMLGEQAPVGPGTYDIALRSAGLAIAAVAAVLEGSVENAYALSRPPGHHCLADQPMGFCFLANIPIAIEAAKARYGIGRIAVLDWDVHHGNGTQAIYEERDDVLTLSIHQDGCFPAGYGGFDDRGRGAGKGHNLNIPLPAGSGHEAYLAAMHRLVLPALRRFEPELIIVACGFDANAVDPLARMQLHSDSFRQLTRLIREAAEELCQGRLVLVHEGGYAEAYVPFCGQAVMEELSGITTAVRDPLLDFIQAQQPSGAFAEFLLQYVETLAARLGD